MNKLDEVIGTTSRYAIRKDRKNISTQKVFTPHLTQFRKFPYKQTQYADV